MAALAPTPLRGRVCAVALAVLALAAGCGEDDGATTREQYQRRASAVCDAGRTQTDALLASDVPTTPTRLLAFVQDVVPLFRTTVQQLRAIPVPEGDRQPIEELLAAGDTALAELGKAAADPRLASRFLMSAGQSVFGQFIEAARTYGLSSCAVPVSQPSSAAGPDPRTFSSEKQQFVEQAAGVCSAAAEAVKPLEDRITAGFPPPREIWAEVLPELVPILQGRVDGLRALVPPAEDAGAVAALLDRAQALVDRRSEAAQSAAAGDDVAFEAAIRPVLQDADDLDADLRRYGLRNCDTEDIRPGF